MCQHKNVRHMPATGDMNTWVEIFADRQLYKNFLKSRPSAEDGATTGSTSLQHRQVKNNYTKATVTSIGILKNPHSAGLQIGPWLPTCITCCGNIVNDWEQYTARTQTQGRTRREDYFNQGCAVRP